MFRSQVRVTPHHPLGLPTRELLQREERCPALHVPTRPGVAHVVPAKVLDTCTLERFVPSSRADLLYRLSLVAEDMQRMLASLRPQHLHRRVVERDGDRFPGLRLVRMNPRELACAIEPLPIADALAQDRPNERECSVHGGVAASVRSLRFGDRIDQGPSDTLKFPIGQMAIEPTQLLLVILE